MSSSKLNDDPVIKNTDYIGQFIQFLQNELWNNVELGGVEMLMIEPIDEKKHELTGAISLYINQLQRMELISISTQRRNQLNNYKAISDVWIMTGQLMLPDNY